MRFEQIPNFLGKVIDSLGASVARVRPRTSKAITDPLLPQIPFALDTQQISDQ